jgi:hypothetical protein
MYMRATAREFSAANQLQLPQLNRLPPVHAAICCFVEVSSVPGSWLLVYGCALFVLLLCGLGNSTAPDKRCGGAQCDQQQAGVCVHHLQLYIAAVVLAVLAALQQPQ